MAARLNSAQLLRVADGNALARAAAERFEAAARRSVRERGRFSVVLAGGSTPQPLYRRLATTDSAQALPWAQTAVLFGDERCVPPAHPSSNFRMARETLLDGVPIPAGHIYRIEGERAPREAATRYEIKLRALFPGLDLPRADLVLLGLGEDGHTASLFPGSAALGERTRWVVENHVAGLDEWRVTLTLPVLCAAREVVFLVEGAGKAAIVAEVFGGTPHDGRHPAELVVPTDGELHVLLDAAAASRLG